ncbi:YraN family protein [Pseudomethylobacillus aquaticus]|uniref:UPF0102 protein ED236_11985 n=1 Tax=Pseudomethylobacillus aquaticus TaxID=2676064 RepID=A0A3N0UUA0_9PROT|nr:YraN family protein [Pseudomethylobacillus aquaticus]ROH84110.1 YraN family protein [Pseudomethylobacillus aquaticus]
MTSTGAQAEALAADYLQHQGLRLLERNFRSRYGEIDLIMQDSQTLVFVEVRLRRHADYGGALASITADKQRKLRITADYYLQSHGNQPCRFDVILMSSLATGDIEWICNAF